VTFVVAAILLLSGACSGSETKDAGTKPSSSPATPTATLIDYTKDDDRGAVLRKAADVSRLHDAPDDFTHFMAGVVDTKVHSSEPDPSCPFFVAVRKLDTSGFAIGGYLSCGGNAEMWARVDGVWREIYAGQDYPDCKSMEKYSVPKTIALDKCFDDGFKKLRDYTG
jgi:hypothetical protein